MNYEGIAMTVAGSDSGGGAGVQADLKTFQAFNVFGVSALTSITSQNTNGVRSIQDISPDIVADQIDMIMEDMGCDAAKTGMVSSEEIIEIIAGRVEKHKIEKLVVDPVMVAKSGDRLLKKEAEKTLIDKLIPLSFLVTPNAEEAGIIAGMKIGSVETAREAAAKIASMGAGGVLVKGGHLEEDRAVDILYNDGKYTLFESEWFDSKNTHGTGCTLSSAITASLARGENLENSVRIAKDYISRAIENAPDIGKGHGPLYHKIIPRATSAFEQEARDFDFWFSRNMKVFESELLAEKELLTNPENAISIGVGSGLFASRLGIKKGIEPAAGMAELAREKGIDVKIGSAENIPYGDETFETVLLSTILSYCEDPLKALRESYRICRRGGHIVLSFLPREGSYSMLYDLARAHGRFDKDRSPEHPYPLKFVKGAQWVSIENVKELITEVGFTDLEYVQTLTRHPRYSNEDIEKPTIGYKQGDFVVIKARKP
ncbi:MAG: bifunctional hydroxymethylpyrimidine kinase/phosphomethylpyrimidine kinase [Candidatus Latescibacteria bacterium]|nr:bifunctional hydroxymethylpyrimidine kinase/phosphomethylpyrimidine kinase [bacterium]MBD3424036.1 bifunctional hydroxymethylpyrimidine kinase/phosphomethylpyrimidine kinase [Candidatus Latescibacterota bacterium]